MSAKGLHCKNPSDCRESVIILYENYSAAIVLSRSQFPYNRRHTIDTYAIIHVLYYSGDSTE